jgi:hypothetical protein
MRTVWRWLALLLLLTCQHKLNNMPNKTSIALVALMIAATSFWGFGHSDSCEPITRPQLKDMLIQLGYTVKDIVTTAGKEKVSVTITKEGLDIPIGAEISPSNSFIWLTVNLGDAPKDTARENNAMLKFNSKAQPNQFYITASGRMMMGVPIANRSVTNADLRERMESLSKYVAESRDLWEK